MKMDFLFGNMFWGLLVILIGLSIILKGFGFKVPIVSIFIAIVIIMFGVKILVGAFKKPHHRGIQTRELSATHREYTTIFSGSDIDLSDIRPSTKTVEVTTVFGSSVVSLPDTIDFEIETNAVFGSVITPDKTDAGLASSRQKLGAGMQKVRVEANAIFGRLEFVFKPGPVVTEPVSPADSTDF